MITPTDGKLADDTGVGGPHRYRVKDHRLRIIDHEIPARAFRGVAGPEG